VVEQKGPRGAGLLYGDLWCGVGLRWLCKQVSEVWSGIEAWVRTSLRHDTTAMHQDSYPRQATEDPSGPGACSQWTFSLSPEQLRRAPHSTTI
jgi:hypothetical protein